MYGLNINPTYPGGTPSLEELKNLGVEALRYTYYDSSGGDQLDQARAQHYTQKVREYRQAGIESLLILTYDTYPGKPGLDASDQDWDNYIERFARRAGQIARLLGQWQPAFQVWNEPDHPPRHDYNPTLREAVFGRMLRRTSQAIKQVLPNAPVVAAGLASGDTSWLARVIDSLGGDLPCDFIAFHPYGQRPERDWPHGRWFFNEGSYVGNLLNNYQRVAGNKPVWITEMGIKHEDLGHDQNKMAEFLRRYYRAMNKLYKNKVRHLFWFCYSDNMVEPFGLLDRAQQPKPIYHAFREAVKEFPPGRAEPVPVVLPPPPPPINVVPVVSQPQPAELAALQAQVTQLQADMARLQAQVQQLLQLQGQPAPVTPSPASPGTRPAPPIENISDRLKRHPSLPYYPSRPLNQIRRVIIHHTAIAPSIGAERVAAYRVDTQGWPGIGYHYFITGDGQIQQTNDLTVQARHAGDLDREAVGIGFAGDFTSTVPSPAQLDAGARLIAWLLPQLGLNLDAVAGYKELAQTQSPGQQWDTGQRWGDQLRQRIQALL